MAHYKGASSEGGRAMILQKKRDIAKEELEIRKRKIEEEMKLSSIDNKFAAHYDAVEAQLKHSTIGLMTLDEMKAKQEVVVKEREKELAQKKKNKLLSELEEKRKQKETQKRQMQTLSFRFQDEDEEEENFEDEKSGVKTENEDEIDDNNDLKRKNLDEDSNSNVDVKIKKEKVDDDDDDVYSGDIKLKEEKFDDCNNDSNSNSFTQNNLNSNDDSNSLNSFEDNNVKRKRKMMKNPEVDTSFLPDRDREEEENLLREKLRQEWVEKQERLKNEDIEITFSYWDGSGHRRAVKMKKGASVYQFLQKALEMLRKDFHELRAVTADQLMYVKEDLIIPHHYTFYDFIVTKARGKSGPLFSFDVHDDVRLFADATVEKEESHAGKVLMRNWYERNKHIFPASRWEPYDPSKNYSTYTVSDRKK